MPEEITNDYLFEERLQLIVSNMAHLRTLGLKGDHILLITAVESFRQSEDEFLCATDKEVAERMGITEETVQKLSKDLQKLGFLVRSEDGEKSYWDLKNLYEYLENYENNLNKKEANPLGTDPPDTDRKYFA